ncbi:PREDICTED: palmitoyl-protein thioesterase 1 [Polistes dominula]|uniref:Palmitoyl-protein thioesterase 1 n=1 Tax=Polistes dominula TaxID=743375 RepID=A0ABM1IKY7_POLDO|nr:PREDICTED: palmitoyl-protein thioesterase 1 [Polistes dominula]
MVAMLHFLKFTVVFCIMLLFTISIFITFTNIKIILNNSPTPIVIWHGMGDSCYAPGINSIKELLQDKISGVYVKCIHKGDNIFVDIEKSYFGNINNDVEAACKEIEMDVNLQNGYNAIGLSQGAQFLRAVAERCTTPPMLNLISFGGQHQGVFGLPHCIAINNKMCYFFRKLLSSAAYTDFVQESLIQAGYWHDSTKTDEYKNKSRFLADINNELHINETYKSNLKKLKSLVLVMFENDTIVQPKETEWFGFYKPGQSVELESLQESSLYKEDRLGLQEMDKLGKIHFISLEGDHLQFTEEWFVEDIVDKFLK